jgi:hypothetical protein
MRAAALSVLIAFALACWLPAQSPIPVIVPAATPAVAPKAPPAPASTGSAAPVLKMLQEMKAANEETLRKQAATLEQLAELEKLADQIKILTKRG